MKEERAMTPLSAHFTLEEMTFSEAAARHNISNRPDAETIARLVQTTHGLERVRALLCRPIEVTSGYRSPSVNAIVGGAANSAHTLGWAADFKSPFGDPMAVCQAIAGSDLMFDQLILEFGVWTHLSLDPRARRQVLTVSHANGTQQGLHR
jgi:zinc D-Ala-D-Ala carboxypeptidase